MGLLRICFLIRNLESYFVGNSYYIEDFSIDMQTTYPLHMKEYLLMECAYSDPVSINPLAYEIVLQNDSDRFSPLAAITMHL